MAAAISVGIDETDQIMTDEDTLAGIYFINNIIELKKFYFIKFHPHIHFG